MITITPTDEQSTFFLKAKKEYKIIKPKAIQNQSQFSIRISGKPITTKRRGFTLTENHIAFYDPETTEVYINTNEHGIELEII